MLQMRHTLYVIAIAFAVFGSAIMKDHTYFLIVFSLGLAIGVFQLASNIYKTYRQQGVFYRDNIGFVHVMIVLGIFFTVMLGFMTYTSMPEVIVLLVFLLISFGWISILLIYMLKVAIYDDGKVFIPFQMDSTFFKNTYSLGFRNRKFFYTYQFHKDNIKRVFRVKDKDLKDALKSKFFEPLKLKSHKKLVKRPNSAVCIEFRTPIKFRPTGKMNIDIMANTPELKKIYVSVAKPESLVSELKS